jgi:hypothetical protein
VSSLVGRARELVVFEEALARAAAGERAVLVLSGEPGIGKSRLLGELATRGSARGAKVAWGRTSEVGLTPAFWPWMQILRALEGPDDDHAPGIGSLGEHTDAASRLAMFDAAVAFIARRAAAQPLVLLFDDVHAADPSSLQLLDYAVPLLADKRVVVAIAARDGDASSDVTSVLGRVQRGARRLPIGRLSRGDVEALVGDRADRARVFELSEGNPLFVEELVASAEAEGIVRLPSLSSVRAVIRERVAHLPETTQRALVAGGLLGRELAGRVLADILDERDIAAALQPAVRRGMIAMTGPDRYRFSHALLAETLGDELDPSERARLHLRAAQALEKHAGDPSEVAHHLLQAGNLAAEAAVTAAERAAHAAMTRLAFEDAAALLDRAMTALQLAAPTDRKRRIELACARVEALQQANDHTRALALLDEIEPLAHAEQDAELIARLALARGMRWTFGSSEPLLVTALRDAQRALGETGSRVLRARVLARLAAALQPAIDPSVPVGHARDAIAMARDLSPADRLDVMYTATGGLVDYVPPAELDLIHEEVLELARSRGARVIAAHTQLRMCFTALERTDRLRFETFRRAYATMAQPLGPRWIRYTHLLDAMALNLDGKLADADRATAEAEAINTALGDQHALWTLGFHHIAVASARGELIGNIDRFALPGAPFAPLRAFAAAHDGNIVAAHDFLAVVGDEYLADVNVGSMVSYATALAGDLVDVTRRYELWSKRAGEVSVMSVTGFCVADIVDRVLLSLAAAAGLWDAIDAHADSALAIAYKLESLPWATRVRSDHAAALVRRGRPGDSERAKALWQQALADADKLGMRRLAEQCRAALAGGQPTARVVSPTPQTIRLEREGVLWIVAGFDDEIRVRDSRGMEMLARLVQEPNRELHVLDLMGASNVDAGDSGELLDAKARAEYKERLAELMAERDRAEEWGDVGRAEKAGDEIEALTIELERAVGLGGRERRAGGAAERARSNVQRRLAHAIQQIRAGSRRLGEHFAATIKTGTLCVYRP